jgi:hypothetical protein
MQVDTVTVNANYSFQDPDAPGARRESLRISYGFFF